MTATTTTADGRSTSTVAAELGSTAHQPRRRSRPEHRYTLKASACPCRAAGAPGWHWEPARADSRRVPRTCHIDRVAAGSEDSQNDLPPGRKALDPARKPPLPPQIDTQAGLFADLTDRARGDGFAGCRCMSGQHQSVKWGVRTAQQDAAPTQNQSQTKAEQRKFGRSGPVPWLPSRCADGSAGQTISFGPPHPRLSTPRPPRSRAGGRRGRLRPRHPSLAASSSDRTDRDSPAGFAALDACTPTAVSDAAIQVAA